MGVYAKLELLLENAVAGKIDWSLNPGTFLPGYAGDDSTDRPLQAAKVRCSELGHWRAGQSLYHSPTDEVSFSKVTPKVPLPLSRGRVLLPSNWDEFHQRVVDEEMEAEEKRERELLRVGKRRLVVQESDDT